MLEQPSISYGPSKIKHLSFSILDLRLKEKRNVDLNNGSLIFYISVLNTEFFTRKNLKSAKDIVIPEDCIHDKAVLEIIVHSNKRKMGKLCINFNRLLI